MQKCNQYNQDANLRLSCIKIAILELQVDGERLIIDDNQKIHPTEKSG